MGGKMAGRGQIINPLPNVYQLPINNPNPHKGGGRIAVVVNLQGGVEEGVVNGEGSKQGGKRGSGSKRGGG